MLIMSEINMSDFSPFILFLVFLFFTPYIHCNILYCKTSDWYIQYHDVHLYITDVNFVSLSC